MSINKKEQFKIFKKGLEIASKLSIDDSNLDAKNAAIANYVPYEELNKKENFHNDKNNIAGRYKMGGLFYCLEDYYIDIFKHETGIDFNILPSHKKFLEYQSYEAYNRLSDKEKEIFNQFIDLHWEYKMVDETGINDENGGYGIDCSRVYYFPTANMYIKFIGYYSSYNGFEYHSFRLVEPQEKTIVVYE